MADGRIQDHQITASTVFGSYNDGYVAHNARLNGSRAWVGDVNINQWIQVEFTSPVYVTGIILQGNPGYENEWITEYEVDYDSDQDGIWEIIKDDQDYNMVSVYII